jgi:molecular chaperone GrpE
MIKEELEILQKQLEDVEKRLKETEEQSEMYLNQLKYTKADLENLHKRTQRHIDEMVKRAKCRLYEQLLPIVDELDLAIQTANETGSSVINGISMIKKKLEGILEHEGVKPIETESKPFDPYYHQALMKVETCDYPDGHIVEEVRKGYLYNGRVIRASMVKVARNKKRNLENE